MSVLALPVQDRTARGDWATALPVLAAAIAAILLLFAADAAAMVRIWWTSSTYEHCLFILPIVGWLLWQRRAELSRLTPRGWAPGLLPVALGAGGWLLGQAAGVAVARHLGLVMMIQGAVVATLGPVVARGLAFPLAFLLFAVPMGEGMVPPLQTLTARMCIGLLHMFAIPARLDGVFITTDYGWFEVAEACSGAKFLSAMIVLGAFAANECFTRPRRRMMFMVAAVAVPVLANGLRAFGTILVARWTGVATAGGFDHIVYGWFFFGFVIAALLGGAWPWFDRDPLAPAFDPARLEPVPPHVDPRHRLAMAVAVVLVAAAPVAWTQAVAGGTRLAPAAIPLPVPPGWTPVSRNDGLRWTPRFAGADRITVAHYRDAAGQTVDLAVAAYGDQSEGHEIVGYGIGPVDAANGWGWASDGPPVADGRAMRIVGPGDTGRDVLLFYRIAGLTTGSATHVKLATLRTRLLGGPQPAVAVILSAQAPAGGSARATLDAFRAALGPVDRIADGATR